MSTTRVERFYARDKADNTWIAHNNEAQAARAVARASGDWTDPVVGYAVEIRFEGKPERIFTEEEHEAEFQRRVKAMLEDILGAPVTFGETARMTASRIAIKHGIKLP